MLIQVRQAVDNTGKKIRLMPRAITCAPANVFQAETILKSALRTSTANNDVNPINSMGLLKEGQYNMSRLTSNTAWWVNTDAPEGLKLMMRRGLKRSMEGDFETDTMRFKATERYIPKWSDPRGVYGTPGMRRSRVLGTGKSQGIMQGALCQAPTARLDEVPGSQKTATPLHGRRVRQLVVRERSLQSALQAEGQTSRCIRTDHGSGRHDARRAGRCLRDLQGDREPHQREIAEGRRIRRGSLPQDW